MDATSGVLRAHRPMMGLPDDYFVLAFETALREQAGAPWPGKQAYGRAFAEVYRRFPTADALLARAVARARFPAR